MEVPREQETAQLPQLPADTTGDVLRNASAVESLPGSEAYLYANGTIGLGTLVLDSTPGTAWAMYRFEGLADRTIEAVSIQLIPGGLSSQYTVGVGNYSTGSWEWLSTSSVPEFEYDLSMLVADIVSRMGNLYIAVVVDGGDTVTLEQLNIFSAEQPGPVIPTVTVDCNDLVIDSPTDIYKVKVVDGDNQAFRIYHVGTHFEYTTPSDIYIIKVYIRMNRGDDYLVYDFPVPDELTYAFETEFYRCIVVFYDYVDDLKRARIWDASGDEFVVDGSRIEWRHPDGEDIVRAVYYYDIGRIEIDYSYPDNPSFDFELLSATEFIIYDQYPDIYKIRVETDDGNVYREYLVAQITWTAGPGDYEWISPTGASIISVKIRPTPGDVYLVYYP